MFVVIDLGVAVGDLWRLFRMDQKRAKEWVRTTVVGLAEDEDGAGCGK